jgi:GT2 family glycosyltransferase
MSGFAALNLLMRPAWQTEPVPDFPTQAFFNKNIWLGPHFTRTFQKPFMTEWDHNSSRQVDHVIGAFYLIRRRIFSELGGLIPDFRIS